MILLYPSLLFLIIFEIVKVVVEIAFVFQFIYMLITRRPSEPVRKFSNKLSTYGYRVMRYLTMNDHRTPFPFADFPNEMEPPES